MMERMIHKQMPVGKAQPGTSPKTPGLILKMLNMMMLMMMMLMMIMLNMMMLMMMTIVWICT